MLTYSEFKNPLKFVVIFMLLLFTPYCIGSAHFESYVNERRKFFSRENELSINSAWELTPEEVTVDNLLTELKSIDNDLNPVPVQFNFVSMRPVIDQSKLFSLLTSLPKGSLLHSHDLSSVDMNMYVNASYMPGCLYNTDVSSPSYGFLSFKSSEGYVPIEQVRREWPGGSVAFDKALYYNFTILQYEDKVDTSGDFLWEKFQPIFGRLGEVYRYLPVFREYYRRSFSVLFADGILRWEMRTSLDGVYDDKKEYTPAESLQIILEELENWKGDDPDRQAFSFGIIMQSMRAGTVREVSDDLIATYALREIFPDTIIGFDLVGHEDPGKTLLYWAPILLDVQDSLLKSGNYSTPVPFLFHAGESNRVSVQDNLVDAVLLNSSRIGHGFGIQGYPSLWPLINAKRVLIESCPISNQLLGLVVDQRNHPVGEMLHHALYNFIPEHQRFSSKDNLVAHSGSESGIAAIRELVEYDSALSRVFENAKFMPSLTVSVSNDDPGFWGIDTIVSYDWYVAVLGWDLNLAGIKQLVVNSIVGAEASVATRAKLLSAWSVQWKAWVASLQQQ